ncbi:MAG: hypothetical protein JXB03_01435 [Spirochaetales bacterium]|nr:hypothetical protein [Spirochaetales bacterium]
MNPIIEKVFQAEESARAAIEEARNRAREITARASAEADTLITAAKEESLEHTRAMMEQAKSEQNAKIESERAALTHTINGAGGKNNPALAKAADHIASLLLGRDRRED